MTPPKEVVYRRRRRYRLSKIEWAVAIVLFVLFFLFFAIGIYRYREDKSVQSVGVVLPVLSSDIDAILDLEPFPEKRSGVSATFELDGKTYFCSCWRE